MKIKIDYKILKIIGLIIGIYFLLSGLSYFIKPKLQVEIRVQDNELVGSEGLPNTKDPQTEVEKVLKDDVPKDVKEISAQKEKEDVIEKKIIKNGSLEIGDIEYFLQDFPQIGLLQGSITNVEITIRNKGNVPLVLEIKSKLKKGEDIVCSGTDKFIYEPSQIDSLEYSRLEPGKISRTNHQRFTNCQISEKGTYTYYAELIESNSGVILSKKSKELNIK